MGSRKKYEKEEHIHSWYPGKDASEDTCVCGGVRVSQAEFTRRKEVWDDYHRRVQETRAYQRFVEQKEAYRRGDMAQVKELALEAKNERKSKTNWLEKPHFPDYQWPKYVILEKEQAMAELLQSF